MTTHAFILERRAHRHLPFAYRCACGRPIYCWSQTEAIAHGAWRKHVAAAYRRNPPSFMEVQEIYQAASKAVPYCHSGDPDSALRIQPWLRKVQAEFDRRLKLAGIPVEGLT